MVQFSPEEYERLVARLRLCNDSQCWVWGGYRTNKGYGKINIRGKIERTHRVMYQMANMDSIPDGMYVCHKCDNPSCCNPNHLFLGNQKQNMHDMIKKGRNFIPNSTNCNVNKLNWDAVAEIRSSKESNECLAQRFCVNKRAIYDVRSGKSWKV